MPPKKASQTTPLPTVLSVSNNEFKEALSARLVTGEELHNREVTYGNFSDFKSEFRLWDNYNVEYLKQSFNIEDNAYRSAYRNAGNTFMGRMGEVNGNPIQSEKNYLRYKLDNLKSLLNRSDLLKSEILSIPTVAENRNFSTKEVFIVHGHDEVAKVKAARFIEQLGLKPIILHEQSSSGRTIIEKIEAHSNVGFGIVLYTQCDVGAVKDNSTNLKFRARQNVVFEHGYLIGKIGRNNVCALVKGEVELPNDISGVVFVPMDDANAWHIQLAKEMKSSGYDIDMNKLF